jgi:pimeloyl-ACP methyl ester carboxylesterase
MNDLQWSRAGRDQGADLARDLGLTPIWLDYNGGLHISENGRDLAARLEALVDLWPRRLERIVLIGHSMGGLVARSAHWYGREAGHRWPNLVNDMVFLGSPHHGAPLEKAGNWVDVVLGATPYAAPFAKLGKVRSAGITDLRNGSLVDEDWLERDRFALPRHDHRHVPLPEDVRCWAIAAATGLADGGLTENLVGDGLVPLDSALGRHRDPARTLAFPPERQWMARGIGHLDLLWDDDVWARLRRWLDAPARA